MGKRNKNLVVGTITYDKDKERAKEAKPLCIFETGTVVKLCAQCKEPFETGWARWPRNSNCRCNSCKGSRGSDIGMDLVSSF
ncbi:hypothetical protein LCGC14_0145580 [marine sediment metagenome]|uniref:Uncharacterized protein n=1 Tax=marine sediment metagenome TaxID=412755 RepID=A0A0F9UZS9_9ZZZZ